jgi:hypothetical protein
MWCLLPSFFDFSYRAIVWLAGNLPSVIDAQPGAAAGFLSQARLGFRSGRIGITFPASRALVVLSTHVQIVGCPDSQVLEDEFVERRYRSRPGARAPVEGLEFGGKVVNPGAQLSTLPKFVLHLRDKSVEPHR